MPAPRLEPFQRFLDRHRDVVWRVCVAAVGRTDADDVFQETFLQALRAYDTRRDGGEASGRAWILQIAHRKAADHHRARGRRAVPVEEVPEVAHHDREPDDEALWALVRALPPRQRAAVTLRVAGDLPHADVARAIGVSEDAARRAHHDGLAALRRDAVPLREDHR